MPIINVDPGEVFEFTTVGGSSNIISQFAGTSQVFTRDIFGWMRITGSSARLVLEADSQGLEVNRPLVSFNRIPLSYGWTTVNTDLHSTNTSSYVGLTKFKETGSFLAIRGTADHLVEIGGSNITGLYNASRPEVRIIRNSDDTGKITISGSNNLYLRYFNGTETLSGSISCTDPYCSITLTGAPNSLGYIVTSATGNWTSP